MGENYYAECHIYALYAECHIYALYAECHYSDCRHAMCRGTFVIEINVTLT